jgi:imidazolonepropionase
VEQSQRILLSGKELLNAEPAFHGEELNQLGSAEMAARVNAKSVSHLEFISEDGIKALSDNKIVAILCPTTLYLLKLKPPPVRRMIEQNVVIAIASDYNPNAMCKSLKKSSFKLILNKFNSLKFEMHSFLWLLF